MASAAEPFEFESRRFTVDEYHRMAEAGVFRPDERVELIRGVVRRMSPKNRAHVVAATKLHQTLVRALGGRAAVFKEDPLKLIRLDSEPEPDILATSSPDIDAYGTEDSKPLLVIEVAASSLRFDMSAKAVLYAEAGVPEYWVLNLADKELIVFRAPLGGAYRDRTTLRAGDRVAPAAWPDVELDVGELFPTSAPPF
jgi:Uma2 family endonuclease